jgi:hypothetical protein
MLAVLGLGLLSFGLIALGSSAPWTGSVALAAAIPAIWLFVKAEAQSEVPMMPLALFRNGTFAGANALTVLLYAALTGALFLLPFLLIHAHSYSAAAAGAAFLPFSIIMGLGSRWVGRSAERLGARLPLIVGCALTASGFVVLGLSGQAQNYWLSVFPGLVIVAIGMTLCVAPLTATVFGSAPAERSGAASGINNAAARAGGLLAVAALGLAFGGADASSMEPSALVDAYHLTMVTATILAALSALMAAMTIRAEPKPEASQSDKGISTRRADPGIPDGGP